MTLGRHRRLFLGWAHFAGRLMPGGRLPRRDTELVILRTAHLNSCQYEFEHHRHLAQKAGVTATEIERLTTGPEAPGWSPRDRALLTACNELLRDQNLSDSTWQTLSEHLDDRRLIELVFLVGHYQMLATAIAALRIEPDRRP
jgi:AhpD family alkylhydroperoxidase